MSRTVEQELAQIAGRSHGVVTRAELLLAGITADEIRGRLGNGALLREYPGVYRVGHRCPERASALPRGRTGMRTRRPVERRGGRAPPGPRLGRAPGSAGHRADAAPDRRGAHGPLTLTSIAGTP
ncbi:MAG: type IV toxin-antitoxin system AbiEi family antitoxin domain-containing protein [Thermoleophilaceae bacterium]